MDQTFVTVLIAGVCVLILAAVGAYFAARVAVRHADDVMQVPQSRLLELQRTRSILLGWLSVLEAFALGDSWRATALRAELGDISTCDTTLVGDADVVANYQFALDKLRNQAGLGLPPDLASQIVLVRVRLLTALAQQERRLTRDGKADVVQPLGHLDLWGPRRAFNDVVRSTPIGLEPPQAANQTAVPQAHREPTPPAGPSTQMIVAAKAAQLEPAGTPVTSAITALSVGPAAIDSGKTAAPKPMAPRPASKAVRTDPIESLPIVSRQALSNSSASKPVGQPKIRTKATTQARRPAVRATATANGVAGAKASARPTSKRSAS